MRLALSFLAAALAIQVIALVYAIRGYPVTCAGAGSQRVPRQRA